MDGERTTQQIWEVATARLGDEGPTQDETIRLLGLLHSADVLRCDVSPDTVELFRRSQRREQSEWWQRFMNPLSLRFPLFDPDAFLDRWLPTVRPLFGWTGALVWLAVVLGAVFLAAAHWTELSEAAGGRSSARETCSCSGWSTRSSRPFTSSATPSPPRRGVERSTRWASCSWS